MTLDTRCFPCACIPAPVPGETMGDAPGPLGPPIGDFISPGGAAPPGGAPGGAAPGIRAISHRLRNTVMQIRMPQMGLGQAGHAMIHLLGILRTCAESSIFS